MSRIFTSVSEKATIKTGIGGNVYAYSSNKQSLVELCEKIQKSPNSIYYNSAHRCYTIRIKSKFHKRKLSDINTLYETI